jgi:hypothetical protein
MSFTSRMVLTSVLCIASSAMAAPITYTFSGTASGTLGGTTFTDALVQETAIGETANVVSLLTLAQGNPISIFVEPLSTVTITIAGIGSTTVTDPSAIWSIPTPVVIASGFPDLPYVILGTLDNPPALNSITGYGALGSNALLGYNLATSFGPLSASPGGVGYPAGLVVDTSSGSLSFTGNVGPTVQGTFAATTTPEPGSFLILSGGLALLLARRVGCASKKS